MVHPVLHFGDLEPGGVAVDAIKAQSKALGLDAAHGLRMGITGECRWPMKSSPRFRTTSA
jgi:hypothetical protein